MLLIKQKRYKMNNTRNLFSPSRIFLILIAATALAFYGCGNDQQKNDQSMNEMHKTNGDQMDNGQMSGQEMPMLGDEVRGWWLYLKQLL